VVLVMLSTLLLLVVVAVVLPETPITMKAVLAAVLVDLELEVHSQ
jgi:hypothetical protein